MNPASVANGVILAENDAILRSVIRAILLHAGQLVFTADDGIEAVMLARRFTARLVLLDIGMPRLNGLLACETIHGMPGYGHVPIILLTGSPDEALHAVARRLGARDIIGKPFTAKPLLARLAPFIELPAIALPPPPVNGTSTPHGQAEVWSTTAGASWT